MFMLIISDHELARKESKLFTHSEVARSWRQLVLSDLLLSFIRFAETNCRLVLIDVIILGSLTS